MHKGRFPPPTGLYEQSFGLIPSDSYSFSSFHFEHSVTGTFMYMHIHMHTHMYMYMKCQKNSLLFVVFLILNRCYVKSGWVGHGDVTDVKSSLKSLSRIKAEAF